LKLNSKIIRRTSLRFLSLFCGFFIIANGLVFTIQANLGVNPWDVLHIGISYQTGLTIGRVMQLVGLLLVTLSLLLKIKPHIGTLLNIIFVGMFIDMVIDYNYIPAPTSLWMRILFYILGVALLGLGIALYISPNLGAGPRDSLMLALTKTSNFSAGMIRTFMEVIAAVAGYFMGGPLGVGTVLFALTIGFFMSLGFSLVKFMKKTVVFKKIWGN
jgi:uncharacterized protein